MALFRSFRTKKILSQLKLNSAVLKNLQSDKEWAEKASLGDNLYVCFVTISLHDFTTAACERLSPEEFIFKNRELQGRILKLLENTPAIFVSNRIPEIQAAFSSNFSGEGFLEKAIQFSMKFDEILHDANNEPSFNLLKPKVGIATGQVITGIVQMPESSFYSFTGRPVLLSRMLAYEHHRFNESILIDNETGISVDMVRPLDLYRLPGYNELYTLYTIANLEIFNEEAIGQYLSGLNLFYLENDMKNAAMIFRNIIKMHVNDNASKTMLGKCEDTSAKAHMRSYRVI